MSSTQLVLQVTGLCASTAECDILASSDLKGPVLEFEHPLVLGVDYFVSAATTSQVTLQILRQRRWRSDVELDSGSTSFLLKVTRVGLGSSSITVSTQVATLQPDVTLQMSLSQMGKFTPTLDISGDQFKTDGKWDSTMTSASHGVALTFQPPLTEGVDYTFEVVQSDLIRLSLKTSKAWNLEASEPDCTPGTFSALRLVKFASSLGAVILAAPVASVVSPTTLYIEPRTMYNSYLNVRSAATLDVLGNGLCGGAYSSEYTCSGSLTFVMSTSLVLDTD